jgi:hypothetical protein
MVNNTAERKMPKQAYIENETVVDFSKKGGHTYSFLGKCVVTLNKPARVLHHYEVTPVEGPNKGKTYTIKLRFDGYSGGELSYYCDVVGKNKKAAEAVHEKKAKRANDAYDAAREVSKKIEAGDLASISIAGKRDWVMKVLEVDYKKGRIYGVNAASYNPSSKRSWASLTHPDVTVTLKQKAAFDPNTDAAVIKQQENSARVGAKRATTRARRGILRDLYSF